MKKVAIITGGSGYIGGFLIEHLLKDLSWDKIYNLDLLEQKVKNERINFIYTDVRFPINLQISDFDQESSWIFNLAALCREPGNEPQEYFDTNVEGAETITAWAEKNGFRNIYFTSTMSTFGRMIKPTPENSPQYPETPYGISKVIAEKIHQIWFVKNPEIKKLIICRPSVIFGPGDNQNIPRMINAIKRGYFVFPGNPDIVKAYGYVLGLIDSIDFVISISKSENQIIYHYAENPLLNLRGMVRTINKVLGVDKPILRVPNILLVMIATLLNMSCKLIGIKTPIHPVRVKKVAYETHLEPRYLIKNGFEFRYGFEEGVRGFLKL